MWQSLGGCVWGWRLSPRAQGLLEEASCLGPASSAAQIHLCSGPSEHPSQCTTSAVLLLASSWIWPQEQHGRSEGRGPSSGQEWLSPSPSSLLCCGSNRGCAPLEGHPWAAHPASSLAAPSLTPRPRGNNSSHCYLPPSAPRPTLHLCSSPFTKPWSVICVPSLALATTASEWRLGKHSQEEGRTDARQPTLAHSSCPLPHPTNRKQKLSPCGFQLTIHYSNLLFAMDYIWYEQYLHTHNRSFVSF